MTWPSYSDTPPNRAARRRASRSRIPPLQIPLAVEILGSDFDAAPGTFEEKLRRKMAAIPQVCIACNSVQIAGLGIFTPKKAIPGIPLGCKGNPMSLCYLKCATCTLQDVEDAIMRYLRAAAAPFN